MLDNPDWLDDVDGLPVICCDVQMRVQQIIVEHKVLKAANYQCFFKIMFLMFPESIWSDDDTRNRTMLLKSMILVITVLAQGGGSEKGITHDKTGTNKTSLQPQRGDRSYR